MRDEMLLENDIVVFERIENRIHEIRGRKVMLDTDLANIYGVETRRLKEQVRRNLHRFPHDFMFELTLEETRQIESLRSQIATLEINVENSKRGKYSKYKPFVFTEHGAVMLASVLNSPTAIEASLTVVRAFVSLRTILLEHQDLAQKIEQLEQKFGEHDKKFDTVFMALKQLLTPATQNKRQIGFTAEKQINSTKAVKKKAKK
jgi:hypothetical protein